MGDFGQVIRQVTQLTGNLSLNTKEKKLAVLTITDNTVPHRSGSHAAKNPMDLDATMIVLEKFKGDVEFLSMVQSALEDVLPLLLHDTSYCAEDLIGAELWSDFNGTAQRLAHLCLQHLAKLPGANLSYSRSYGDNDGGFQITGHH